jgi:hypothetical protein
MDRKQMFNEALELQKSTVDLRDKIEASFFKHFPQGWIEASARHMFGEDVISMKFGLVANRKELTGGYYLNDPLKQGFITRPHKKGYQTEQTQGWLSLTPAEGSYNAMDSLNTKFRKYSGDEAKTVKAFDKYFTMLQKVVKDNESNIYNRSKYSDKYFK